MLYRKIEKAITEHLQSNSKKILLIDGARQVGKTFIVRHVGKKIYKNFVEINMLEDSLNEKLFKNVSSLEDFYIQLGLFAGKKLGNADDTLVFLDEIQAYPELLTLLKFLSNDNKYTYIASGSLLGVALSETSSIPMGSISKIRMFPLDFEEFLYANGVGSETINTFREKFSKLEPLEESTHNRMLDLFKKYLIVGGMPDAVNEYIESKNIPKVRSIQQEIREYYATDASKYDKDNKLKIRKIYDMLPSNMCKQKKRVVIKDIDDTKGKTFSNYENDFEYLISSGIALDVQAISNPTFPLVQSMGKNLLKLYLNDVGLLTEILYKNNVQAILNDDKSINLGAVYETVVASELIAHGHKLYYYDNRNKGEIDFLIDDYDELSICPIEVKSGRDYTIHSALSNVTSNGEYNIKRALVLSNNREITTKGKIVYIPAYYVMFL